MLKSFVIVFVFVLLASVSASDSLNSRYEQLVNSVNNAKSTWTAGVNDRFAYDDLSAAKVLLGALDTPSEMKLPILLHEIVQAPPAAFDSRTQWGALCPSTNEIRDQSACGSCWAFGAVEAATDRMCIATNGSVKFHLSANDLLSCCGLSCGSGCNGGYTSAAWTYLKNTGIVSGGNYGDSSQCSMYPFPQCDHHVSGKYGPCPSAEYSTPKCTHACDSQSSYNVTFTADKHKFKTSYSVSSNIAQIQTEILTYGPVEGSFTVYEDFLTYTSGVYQHTSGSALGGHAIKIIGWGVDNGTPYWTVANSWNEDWGNKGYFNILRGKNECGIEGGIVAGQYI